MAKLKGDEWLSWGRRVAKLERWVAKFGEMGGLVNGDGDGWLNW
jgi:hypothetical protein